MKAVFNDQRLPQSFWERVITEPNSGCWLWIGALTGNGYPRFEGGGGHLAHRAVVALHECIDGMTVDHKCETECCVNPDHLQVVTGADNTKLRSARKSKCPQGHVRPPGAECVVCRRARHRKYKDKMGALKREILAEIK